MNLVHPSVNRYLGGLAPTDDPVLREMEALAAERDFPIIGPQVGRLLQVLTVATGARRVLELGSGFGYSATWFAKGVGPKGLVVLTEGSPERAREAESFLKRAGLLNRVRIEVGDALKIAARERGPFDLILNDIDKADYPKVAPLAARLLRRGGLLVSDNMLWHGEVMEKRPRAAAVRGILGLTGELYGSGEFFTALVPLRDGVTISVRS
ncbi:MAG: O-methyltransferase [Acidobacteriia bacterium]|nr:O-methyltransferase [Terriglobia bacterium]MBZ5696554.1 O-methyltransferase [Terriglobia bacterium]